MTDTALESSEKISPQEGYGKISGTFISTCDKFLGRLQTSIEALGPTGSPPSLTDGFLTQFLAEADSFSSACCRELATMIRASSTQPEVRDTSEPVLAKLIRNRCFDRMDSVLLNYVNLLDRLNINLSQARTRLGDSKIRDMLSIQASSSQASSGEAGATLAAGPKGKSAAVLKLLEYLEELDKLPHELLDYGALKLFPAEADLRLESEFLLNAQDGIQVTYQGALSALDRFEEVKRKRWEDQRMAETANVKEAAMNSLLNTNAKKTGYGSLVVGGVCAVLVWVAASSGITHKYVLIGEGVVALIGVIFFFRGIASLTKQ